MSGGRQPWYVYFVGPAPLATRAEPPHRCQAGESRRYDAQETFPKGSTWRVTSPDAHRKTGQEKPDFNAPSIMAWGKPCTRRAEATGLKEWSGTRSVMVRRTPTYTWGRPCEREAASVVECGRSLRYRRTTTPDLHAGPNLRTGGIRERWEAAVVRVLRRSGAVGYTR